MKKILIEKHPILTQLMNDNVSMKFNLNLQTKNRCKRNIVIPYSVIAKELEQDGDIIKAFKSLYNKYIDSNKAPFMVNIASRQREILTHSLNETYYKQQSGMNNSDSKPKTPKLRMLSIGFTSIGNSKNNANDETAMENIVDSKNNNNNSKSQRRSNEKTNENVMKNIDHKCFVYKEWKKDENPSIEWLLQRLIVEMDGAAIQVSNLMNDSFQRFRANAPTIVKEFEE